MRWITLFVFFWPILVMSDEVTVYQSGSALIREQRSLELVAGEQAVSLGGFPLEMRPETLFVDPTDFIILEQEFSLNPPTRSHLLDQFVGKELVLETRHDFQDRVDRQKARLVAIDGGPIYVIDGELHMDHPGHPLLPEGVPLEPALNWTVRADKAGTAKARLNYLVGGVSWQADYVLSLVEDEKSGALQGWATVSNQSGREYKDSILSLVAGEVRQESAGAPKVMMMRSAEAFDAAPQPAAMGEYYRYRFERAVTLPNKASKQLQFLSTPTLAVAKELRFRTSNGYLGQAYGEPVPISAEVRYKLKADRPLPSGRVRVYGADGLLGEDTIAHTPKDADVALYVGRSFDVRAVRKQLEYQQVTTRKHRSKWEITVTSGKSVDVPAFVDEMLSGDWRVTESSLPFEKLDSSTIRFTAALKEERSCTITYTVETEY